QIKRYLHISNINSEKLCWFDKVEPLSSHIRNISKQIYMPGSNVAIDEMMIRFSGRSKHTFRMKNKPISEGYKVISLCEKGYTYTFTYESHVETNQEASSISGLNKTRSIVSYLVIQLSNNNEPVHMLSTIYSIKGNKWKTLKLRRRPRETSSNVVNV
ncbi:10443_t:CDS:2, partial [Dentiscutata erythropus]